MASSTNRTSRADRGTPGGTHDAKAAAGRKTARPSPMFDDAIRLIRILQLIPQNRPIDTQEIQEELRREGIDLPIRTLQRYLQTIRSDAADFAIDCDETVRPRRYRWSPNAKGIQLPRLSPVEAVLLRFAEEGLRHHLPTGALNGLRPMLRTAKRNLAPDAARANTSWLEKIVVTPPTLPVTVPAIRASVFEAAVEALFSEMVMHGRYRRDTGRFSEIDLHPLGLIQHQSRTFVVGYEEPRGVKHTLARIRRRRLEEAGQPVEEERPVIGLYALHRFDDARVTLLPASSPRTSASKTSCAGRTLKGSAAAPCGSRSSPTAPTSCARFWRARSARRRKPPSTRTRPTRRRSGASSPCSKTRRFWTRGSRSAPSGSSGAPRSNCAPPSRS